MAEEKKVRHRILLVDDDPDALLLECERLRTYDIVTAQSGEEALRILKTHRVHVVVADQRMPGMSGLDLCRAIHAKYNGGIVRVLYMGALDAGVMAALNCKDVWKYLLKDHDPGELEALLEEACARADQENLLLAITRLENIEKDQQALRHEVRRQAPRLARVEERVEDVAESTNPGVDVADQFRKHADSLGDHEDKIGQVMGVVASLSRKVDGQTGVMTELGQKVDGQTVAMDALDKKVDGALIKLQGTPSIPPKPGDPPPDAPTMTTLALQNDAQLAMGKKTNTRTLMATIAGGLAAGAILLKELVDALHRWGVIK